MRTQKNHPRLFGTCVGLALLCLALLAWTGVAAAQLPPAGAAWQFDITGFLQEATVSGATPLAGGSLKVNGHMVTVPANTIVILPANALTWQELFAQAPAPYTGVATGMAAADVPAPLAKYEVHVVGNVMPGATAGQGTYIAGLIDISQQGLNHGAGYINFIDYVNGELRVGGTPGSALDGTRVRINDPTGKFGRANAVGSTDNRFTLDPDNPTIRSVTGFPMCLPRTDPAGGAADGLCPEANRPALAPGVGVITTNDPATGLFPSALFQAPFEVGDYVDYAGTLVQDCVLTGCAGGGPTVGPWPLAGTAATFVSAHTITDNIAIYTFPGTNPAYIATDVTLLGTGGNTVIGIAEAAIRTRFEGFTTDPSRIVHLYGMDLTPAGVESDRDWGTVGVDPGAPTGAVKGRWRFRPPCTATTTTITDKNCSPPPTGVFLPATREVRAVLEAPAGSTTVLSAWNAAWPTCAAGVLPTLLAPCNVVAANNLISGQYHAPILEYIFPEQVVGNPVPPANFETMPFLNCGGYSSSAGTLAGVLSPWPGTVAQPACAGAATAPVANAGTNQTVASGALVTLDGSASTGTAPLTFAWTAPAGITLSPGGNNAIQTFTAPTVGANTPLVFSLTVSNSAGSSTASVTITVTPPGVPIVGHVAPQTVNSGAPVTMNVTATSTNPTAVLSLSVVQTNTPVVALTVTQTSATTWTVTFTAPTLPPGQTVPDVLNFSIVATDTSVTPNLVSATEFTTVTVNPTVVADTITIQSAEYRKTKQRLIINATSLPIGTQVLTLQPYLTTAGTIFNPGAAGVFTNNGAGLYILTLVGAPRPACNSNGNFSTPCTLAPLDVKSSQGGDSGFFALTKIR